MALSRREFVSGGFAAAALAPFAGCSASPADLAERYDVCVIGSSFAGLPVALGTAAAGRTTLVIEAGSPPGEWFGRSPQLAFTRSGGLDYALATTTQIAVGGASNHWSGTVNRMLPEDFRVRSQFGADVDWPLDYDELEPWYCAAERALSVRGHAAVPGAEPPRSCAYPVVDEPYAMPRVDLVNGAPAYFPLAKSERDGAPVRLVDREVEAFGAAGGQLLAGHTVTRLVSNDGTRIDHAVVRSADGTDRRIRAKLFVLAAGVVESARLLLLSRGGAFPAGIGNGEDLVGRHFVEHPTLRWEFAPASFNGLFDVLDDGGNLPREPNRTYHFYDRFRRAGLGAAHFQLRVSKSDTLILKCQPDLEPRRDNRIALSKTGVDDFGDPLADLEFAYSQRDERTFAEGRRLLGEMARALGAPTEIQRSLKWRWHPSTTTRMGSDPSSGVVDRDLRVFGVDNLYVSGASVFPVPGTANPTATVVALALRLADHLLARD